MERARARAGSARTPDTPLPLRKFCTCLRHSVATKSAPRSDDAQDPRSTSTEIMLDLPASLRLDELASLAAQR